MYDNGNRDEKNPRNNDTYEPDRQNGCKYTSSDSPGASGVRPAIERAVRNGKKFQIDLDIEIRIRINDYCCVYPKDKPFFNPITIPIKCSATIG